MAQPVLRARHVVAVVQRAVGLIDVAAAPATAAATTASSSAASSSATSAAAGFVAGVRQRAVLVLHIRAAAARRRRRCRGAAVGQAALRLLGLRVRTGWLSAMLWRTVTPPEPRAVD